MYVCMFRVTLGLECEWLNILYVCMFVCFLGDLVYSVSIYIRVCFWLIFIFSISTKHTNG